VTEDAAAHTADVEASEPAFPPRPSTPRPWGTWLLGALIASVIVAAVAVAVATRSSGSPHPSSSSGPMTAPTDGLPHTGPSHYYVMQLAPGWTPGQTAELDANDAESWGVATTAGKVTAVVNVISTYEPDIDLGRYLDFVRAKAESLGDGGEIHPTIITGWNGNQLGRYEYVGTPVGAKVRRHFLSIVDASHGKLVITTLGTPEADFAAISTAVEPYLRTLQATSGPP
jgi:hypothetical protein